MPRRYVSKDQPLPNGGTGSGIASAEGVGCSVADGVEPRDGLGPGIEGASELVCAYATAGPEVAEDNFHRLQLAVVQWSEVRIWSHRWVAVVPVVGAVAASEFIVDTEGCGLVEPGTCCFECVLGY